MATTRKQDLKQWWPRSRHGRGRSPTCGRRRARPGAEQQLVMSGQIAALRQQRRAYEAQMADTRGASAAVFRDMQRGAERMAEEFRKLYLQTASRFPC